MPSITCKRCGKTHLTMTATGAAIIGHARIVCNGKQSSGMPCRNVLHYREKPTRQGQKQKDAMAQS